LSKPTVENLEKNLRKLTVEVEQEIVDQELDRAFQRLRRNVNIAGFRKGRIPRPLFERRYGRELLYEEALEHIVSRAYGQAIEDAGLEPIDQPEVDVEQIEEGKPLTFTAVVQVKPEVSLPDYKSFSLPLADRPDVTPEDVDEELHRLREKQAQASPITEEEAVLAEGLLAIIDYEGRVGEEEPFRHEDYLVRIGDGTLLPQFEENIKGARAGERRSFTVSYPDDYVNTDLSGKEVAFQVTVKELKRLELPELNDEFARTVGEYETLDSLREDIRLHLELGMERERLREYERQVVDKLVQESEVEVPEVMVERRVDREVEGFAQQLQGRGSSLDSYKEMTGKTDEDIRDEMRQEAADDIRRSLVLEAVARAEQIEVTAEEFDRAAEDFVRAVGLPQLRRVMRPDSATTLNDHVLATKTVRALASWANESYRERRDQWEQKQAEAVSSPKAGKAGSGEEGVDEVSGGHDDREGSSGADCSSVSEEAGNQFEEKDE